MRPRPSFSILAALVVWAASSAPAAPQPAAAALTIEQAVEEALQRNLPLMVERFNVTAAEADVITARLRPNPVLSLEADQIDPWTGLTDERGAGRAEYAVRADFLLERGGKRALRIEVAQTALSIARLQLLDRRRTLAFEVQSACWLERMRSSPDDDWRRGAGNSQPPRSRLIGRRRRLVRRIA